MYPHRYLVADAGATKTDWAFAQGTRLLNRVKTQGISPVHQTELDIRRVLVEELRPLLLESPHSVYFYGAGCTPDRIEQLQHILSVEWPRAEVEIRSDLWGAARALCGKEAGVACILGTGANSCLYNGQEIVRNTPPLGFILGDEGSGAAMGRDFVANVFKGLFPSSVCEEFLRLAKVTYAEVIEHVYREPLPARFLASMAPAILALRAVPEVHKFLIRHFTRFLQRNIAAYESPQLPLHFVGSIAYHFQEELSEAIQAEGYVLGRIVQSPMQGLLAYHAEI